MALDKLVDSAQLDSDLASVANAIRTKGGTSAQLAFPQGFVSAVQNIQTGITPTGTKQITITENGTTTENVAQYAGVEISVNVPTQGEYDESNFFARYVSTAKFVYDGVLSLHDYRFGKAFGAQSIVMPKATCTSQYGAQYFLWGNTHVLFLVFPAVTRWGTDLCRDCNALQGVDVAAVERFDGYGFRGCSSLSTLVIRSANVPTLSGVDAFNGTPFASGGTGGTLYVPQALISSYQSATNWSTLLGYTNNQILPLEGSAYETQYVDGTPIQTT